MTIALTDLLREAGFGLYGIRRSLWNGPSFVGTAARTNSAVRSVELVYLDSIDETTMGLAVSSIDGSAVASGAVDPIQTHLTGFVPRFDARFVVERMSGRRAVPFPEADFAQRTLTTMVAGASAAAVLLVHKQLPLQLLRVAVRASTIAIATDIGIAAWRLDSVTFTSQIERVDPAFAKDFDPLSGADAYPPPEWT